MPIAYCNNSSVFSGVGHRAHQIKNQLPLINPDFKLVEFHLDGQRGVLSKNGRPVDWLLPLPRWLNAKSINWLRLGQKLDKYITGADKNNYAGFHATNQSLSFLRKYFDPFIVTVHDLIELTDPQSRSGHILSKYLYRGLARADHIIAVSAYTAGQVAKVFNIPQENITVIYNGVDDDFHPIMGFKQSVAYQLLRRELAIPDQAPVLLFVGSDHPRKNLSGAVDVLAKVRKIYPETIMIKVGEPGLLSFRARLLEKLDALGLRSALRLVNQVPEPRLNEIYNLADVLLFPSRHEGFGLPPLQALAAGTPVVAARSTSIPEVVADAALLHDADDTDGMAESVTKIFQQTDLAQRLISAGLERAQKFSWLEAARAELNVYGKIFKL